jgi:TetR/AcrR family transcriptional repressor of mexJK operon
MPPTHPRPGRPKSQEKAAAILQAAGDLFLSQGLNSTSMEAVAQRAGVSKQTVYGHFENKDELFRRCIGNKVASYGFDEQLTPPEGELRTALLGLVRQFFGLITDPEVCAMHRVVIAESAQHGPIAELFYAAGPERTRGAVANFLRGQAALGRLALPEDRVDHAAVQLLNMTLGDYQMRRMMGLLGAIDPDEAEAHLRQVVEDFLKIYAPD